MPQMFVNHLLVFQLIPARGRKLVHLLLFQQNLAISTYPRKGTKTFLLFDVLIVLVTISTYPRKGTKTQ